MDAVSIYDHMITAIRESQLSRPEAEDVIRELYASYPEAFEQLDLQGEFAQLDSDALGDRRPEDGGAGPDALFPPDLG